MRKVNLVGYIQRCIPMLLVWGVMVHEYGHLIALRLMGLYGEIRSTGLNLTWLVNGATPLQVNLWQLSGGLLQCVYGLYNMYAESDNETWLSGFTVACQGFIYAWFEMCDTILIGSLFSIVITLLLVIVLQAEGRIDFE